MVLRDFQCHWLFWQLSNNSKPSCWIRVSISVHIAYGRWRMKCFAWDLYEKIHKRQRYIRTHIICSWCCYIRGKLMLNNHITLLFNLNLRVLSKTQLVEAWKRWYSYHHVTQIIVMCDYTPNLPQKTCHRNPRCAYHIIIYSHIKGILQPLSASFYDVDNTFPYDVNLTLLIWDCACYRHAEILRRIIRIITCSKYNAPTELLSARHVIIMWPRDTWQRN